MIMLMCRHGYGVMKRTFYDIPNDLSCPSQREEPPLDHFLLVTFIARFDLASTVLPLLRICLHFGGE